MTWISSVFFLSQQIFALSGEDIKTFFRPSLLVTLCSWTDFFNYAQKLSMTYRFGDSGGICSCSLQWYKKYNLPIFIIYFGSLQWWKTKFDPSPTLLEFFSKLFLKMSRYTIMPYPYCHQWRQIRLLVLLPDSPKRGGFITIFNYLYVFLGTSFFSTSFHTLYRPSLPYRLNLLLSENRAVFQNNSFFEI